MFSNRSRFEILLELLNVIMDGETKPTRIMYQVNLSWKCFDNNLRHLVKNGLVEEQRIQRRKRDIKRYNITEEGRNVLKYYKNFTRLINVENLQLDY